MARLALTLALLAACSMCTDAFFPFFFPAPFCACDLQRTPLVR